MGGLEVVDMVVGGRPVDVRPMPWYSAGGSCSLLPRPVPPAAPFPTLNARGRKGRVRGSRVHLSGQPCAASRGGAGMGVL